MFTKTTFFTRILDCKKSTECYRVSDQTCLGPVEDVVDEDGIVVGLGRVCHVADDVDRQRVLLKIKGALLFMNDPERSVGPLAQIHFSKKEGTQSK